jgi:hypothetical protein
MSAEPAMDSPGLESEADLVPVLRVGLQRYVPAGVAHPQEIFWRLIELYTHPLNWAKLSPELKARLPDVVRREVRDAIACHIREQETWGVTDCDRLDRAFAELQSSGIACFAAANVIPYRKARGDQRVWFEEEMRRLPPGQWRAYVYWDEGHAWRCLKEGFFGLPSRFAASQRVPPGQPYRDRARVLDEEIAGVLERCGVQVDLRESGLWVRMKWQRRRPLTDLDW